MTKHIPVPEELLHRLDTVCTGFILVGKEIRESVDATEKTRADLRALLNGPGVEPVARYRGRDGEYGYDIIDLSEELAEGTPLYIAAPSAPVPDPVPEIDLRVSAYEQLLQAATESNWIPPEYYVNDWIADCCAFLRNGHDSVAPVQAVPDWRPIETAPKDGEWALVYACGAINCAFVKQDSIPDDWTQPSAPNVIPERVTHWMPLPQPPKESTAQSVVCPKTCATCSEDLCDAYDPTSTRQCAAWKGK